MLFGIRDIYNQTTVFVLQVRGNMLALSVPNLDLFCSLGFRCAVH